MPSPNRSEKLTTRYRPRERELLEAAAEEIGVHVSELIRETSVEAARRGLRAAGRDLPPEIAPRDLVGE